MSAPEELLEVPVAVPAEDPIALNALPPVPKLGEGTDGVLGVECRETLPPAVCVTDIVTFLKKFTMSSADSASNNGSLEP